MATLRLVEPALSREPWHLRRVRELTEPEQQRFLAGQSVAPGEIVREDIWAARTAERVTQARAASSRRAERAEREAARMRREAKRFDSP